MNQFFENNTDNQKLELEKMFPLHDIRLDLGFNFHVCNYFISQYKSSIQNYVSAKLMSNKKISRATDFTCLLKTASYLET